MHFVNKELRHQRNTALCTILLRTLALHNKPRTFPSVIYVLVHIVFIHFIFKIIHFYRVTACNAMHGIPIAILSVRPFVRRVYCDKTK